MWRDQLWRLSEELLTITITNYNPLLCSAKIGKLDSLHTSPITHNTILTGCVEQGGPHLSKIGALNVKITRYKGHMVDPISRNVRNVRHFHFCFLWRGKSNTCMDLLSATMRSHYYSKDPNFDIQQDVQNLTCSLGITGTYTFQQIY